MSIEKIGQAIADTTDNVELSKLYVERAKIYQANGDMQSAINDFNDAVRLDDTNHEAKCFLEYIYEILDCRYMEMFNV